MENKFKNINFQIQVLISSNNFSYRQQIKEKIDYKLDYEIRTLLNQHNEFEKIVQIRNMIQQQVKSNLSNDKK